VDIAAGLDRRDFDAVNQGNPARRGGAARLGVSGQGIVVGDADSAEAGGRRAGDEVARRQRAVGCGGVEVKIDQPRARR